MWVLYVVLLASAFSLASCQLQCSAAKTCGQCIGHSYECVWCPAVNHSGPRCQTNEYDAKNSGWCAGKVYNPQVKHDFKVNSPAPFNSGQGGSPTVQITPQRAVVTARPGKTVSFTARYRPAEDYPLDVYYLMDFSWTMKKTLNLLRQQGQMVYKSLSSYTSNLKLGIGTFIEKKAFPYADPLFQFSYAFRNELSLTNDTKKFKEVLNISSTGSNYDHPEAGLDALMQAMVCGKELEWRTGSRKIIVLCTDNTYHSAGDGKMAGAAKLNDMRCHLNSSGYYDLEFEQDYPTVNQINKIAKQQNMIVIFNVFKSFKREYEALAKKIKGASYVELKEEGKNIVETITKAYSNALRYLQMNIQSPTNERVSVSLDPDCTNDYKSETCAVTPEKKILTLRISITPRTCINKEENVILNPVGLGEKLSIQVKTLCECECEKHGIPNAVECGGRGTLQCGICKCNENSFGDKCECTGDSSTLNNADKCRAKAGADECTGRGTCRCGTCDCKPGFSGKFCQFDDNGCARADDLLCGGRGRCHEGSCHCRRGWTGDACQCTTDTTECRIPLTQTICSGTGNCVCGKCVCTKVDSKNNVYTGAFCESCNECDDQQCGELEKYVKCLYFNTNATCEGLNTDDITVTMVNRTEYNDPAYHLAKHCERHQEDGRSLLFRHKYKGRKLELVIQNELEEPDRANLFIAIGSSLGAVLLLGLLIVVGCKVAMDFHDKREYERFSRQLDQSVDPANVNVLYKPPTANFANPLYRRSRLSTQSRV